MKDDEEMLSDAIYESDVFDDDSDAKLKSKILSVLALRKRMTMSKVEKACSISQSKASTVMNELKDKGYIVKTGEISSGTGRPNDVYDLTSNWVEKLNNEILEDIDNKLAKIRVINTIISDGSED